MYIDYQCIINSYGNFSLRIAWVLDDKSQLDLKPFNDNSTSVSDNSGMLMFSSLLYCVVVAIATLVSHDSSMLDNVFLLFFL